MGVMVGEIVDNILFQERHPERSDGRLARQPIAPSLLSKS